uniref:Electron transport protein n=1 Tax=uncultured Acidobacteria bacterium A3 TaxID=1036853 RepID=F8TTJ0_9BACT|nr:electron transport protein [uncultured Acidobacteria bacterium A3]
MKYVPLIVAALLVVVSAEERRTMTGVVLKVDPAARTMIVSTDKVAGFMEAMAMPFAVPQAAMLSGLKPGSTIEFTYVVDKDRSHAENIKVRGFESLEQKPLELRRLKLLNGIASPESRAGVLKVDERVPDFVLTDQARQRVAFSKLAGKVVAVTFTYIRCPNPAYCFRLASNFAQLEKRFKDRVGRDLVFLTIVIDPEHDQQGALADYARTWTTNPAAWHFLTGPLPEIKRVSHLFGVDFWGDEGSIIHSFNTAVIDRQGKLAANLEGNLFTPQQLGDVVQTVLDRR